MDPRKRIGEMLLEAGIIDEAQLKAALGHQRQWGGRLGRALVELKLATEQDVVRALSLKFGLDVANLRALDPYGHEQAAKLFPPEFAVSNNVFPMWADSANVTVAMSDPTNLAVVDEIRFRTARRVKVCIGGEHEIAAALQALYPVEAPIALDLEVDLDEGGDVALDPFGVGGAPAPRAPSAPPRRPAPTVGAMVELEVAPRGSARAAEKEDDAVELTSLQEPAPPGDAAPGTERRGAGEDASRELSARDLAILDSLDRLAHGTAAEPEIVKPVQAMAAMVRLLIRKRVVTEQEFLDELSKK